MPVKLKRYDVVEIVVGVRYVVGLRSVCLGKEGNVVGVSYICLVSHIYPLVGPWTGTLSRVCVGGTETWDGMWDGMWVGSVRVWRMW